MALDTKYYLFLFSKHLYIFAVLLRDVTKVRGAATITKMNAYILHHLHLNHHHHVVIS
jgi:hypothetical protein